MPAGIKDGRQSLREPRLESYDVVVECPAMERLEKSIAAGPFQVHVARVFPLEEAAALRALESHFLGKIALRTG